MKTVRGKNFTMIMTGENVTQERLLVISIGQRELFNRVMYDEGRGIYNSSQKKVPVMTGALKESGKIVDGESTSGDPSTYEIAIGYGANNVNPITKTATKKYARYQHEMNKRKPKFLELPFLAALGGMTERVAMRMKSFKG